MVFCWFETMFTDRLRRKSTSKNKNSNKTLTQGIRYKNIELCSSICTFLQCLHWLLLLNFHSRFFLFIIQSNTVKFFSLLSESLSSSPLLSFLVCQTITFLWLHDAGDVTFSLLLSWGRPSSSYRYPFALCFKQLLAGVLVFCLYLFTFFFFLLCLTWIMNHFNNDFEDTCC